MSTYPFEAIVLSITPLQDYHLIASLFTPHEGLYKVIGSYARRQHSPLFNCLTPLNHLEIIIKPTQNELKKIEYASSLNTFQEIRGDFSKLQAACQMIQSISKSQVIGKAAPLLFELLKSYLGLLKNALSPSAILASFQLKILRHEGLLSPHPSSLELSNEEIPYFEALALTTSINLLIKLQPPETLPGKIQQHFEESLGRT